MRTNYRVQQQQYTRIMAKKKQRSLRTVLRMQYAGTFIRNQITVNSGNTPLVRQEDTTVCTNPRRDKM